MSEEELQKMFEETDRLLAPWKRGIEEGVKRERERIADWVREHRSTIEIADGVFIYREHFDSESLLEFIEGTAKSDE
jgi:hypothetical protein